MQTVTRVVAPVRSQVQDLLKLMIFEGQLAPGDRLIERDLCQRFGVSRPLLREALRQLDAEGLVTSQPNGGVVVKMMTVEEATDVYAVRAFLEGGAARLTAQLGTDDAIEALRERTRAVERALGDSDPLALRRAKNAFYEALQESCGNPTLAEMLRIVHGRIHLLRTLTLNEPGRMAAAVAEIRAIFDAIEARDAEEAFRLSVRHIENAASAMRKAWRPSAGTTLEN